MNPKDKIFKIIENRISKSKDNEEREKLKELEEAVKKGKKEKIKEILKDLPSNIGGGLIDALTLGLGFS